MTLFFSKISRAIDINKKIEQLKVKALGLADINRPMEDRRKVQNSKDYNRFILEEKEDSQVLI